MHLLKINEKLKQGIEIINEIPQDSFNEMLIKVISKNSECTNNTFSDNEIRELASKLQLSTENIKHCILTIDHIHIKLSKYLMKPSDLIEYLQESLKLSPEKSEEIVRQWSLKLKDLFQERDNVTGVKWSLNVQLASLASSKDSHLTSMLQFTTDKNKNVTLNLSYEDAVALYTVLENIQNDIDYLDSSNLS